MPTIKQRLRRRKTRLLFLFVVLVPLATWKLRPKPYDALAWRVDYYQLRDHIRELYPNLDWSAVQGGADLRKVNATAYQGLVAARSDKEAGRVLRRFVRSFHDPHMCLLPASAPSLDPPPSLEPLSRFTAPEKACAAMSFKDDTDGFAFKLESMRWSEPLRGWNSFPAALVDTADQRFGLLRIGSFDERDYRGACLREWPSFSQALPGTCEADCQRDFSISVAGRLLRELAWQVRQLRHAGVGALLIDITGNSGGHSWYRRAAEILTSGPIPAFRAAFVKGSYTAERLQGRRQQISHYLATHRLTLAERAVFDQALCRLDDLFAEAEKPCRTGLIWTIEPWRAGCSRLTNRPLFGTGLFEEDPGVDLPFEVARTIYVDRMYPPVPSAWSGPVAVLVDGGTASAAEFFAAHLKFSAGAVLIGRHTASTGGGWSLGRRSWTLPISRMKLYLPDSVQYWPNGVNAREGLEPDIPTPKPPRDNPDATALWLYLMFMRGVVAQAGG